MMVELEKKNPDQTRTYLHFDALPLIREASILKISKIYVGYRNKML